MDTKELKRLRLDFLKKSYEVAEGNLTIRLNTIGIGELVGITDKQLIYSICQYLYEENLVELAGKDGISLTKYGINKVEAEGEEANIATPIIMNHYNISDSNNTSIITGHNNNIQNIISNSNVTDINKFLSELKSSLNNLNLTNEKKEDIESDIKTVEVQLSNKPKKMILLECFKSIRTILEGATGGAIGTELADKAGKILELIQTVF